jgi:hypothetical protein
LDRILATHCALRAKDDNIPHPDRVPAAAGSTCRPKCRLRSYQPIILPTDLNKCLTAQD